MIKNDCLSVLQNSDMFWKPTVAIQADVASFIIDLSKGLRGYKCDQEWIQKLLNKDIDKESINRWIHRNHLLQLVMKLTKYL